MKRWIFGGFVALCVGLTVAGPPHEHKNVVCFWNSTSTERQGPGKFQVEDLKSAVSLCTHLIYGYAGIDASNHKVMLLHPHLADFYKLIPQFKVSSPKLKVYLSIGGNADPVKSPYKYLIVTETSRAREIFIKSVDDLISKYKLFDGIDLAWQFPEVEEKKKHGILDSIWHEVKKFFGYENFKDEKETKHRVGFTTLVKDLNIRLRPRSKALTLTVLPHVNAIVYYEVKLLAPNIDAVHLMAFDQKTPERNPKEADYPAPIYESYGRIPQDNIDSPVRYWLAHGTPSNKIIVGIPTFARTWKLTSNSQISGVPPIITDGPGAAGLYTQIPGLLTYGEVCGRLTKTVLGRVQEVSDPSNKFGSYAYLPYNSKTGADGIWMGYETPETAGNKAFYSVAKDLGGVAIFDLSTDDFRGACTGQKFPIVRAAKYKL